MKKHIMPLLLIFVSGCATNTPSKIDCGTREIIRQTCEPIYGRASDWDVISDDLARHIYRHNRLCEEQNKNSSK